LNPGRFTYLIHVRQESNCYAALVGLTMIANSSRQPEARPAKSHPKQRTR
jgi:hypothetical protein